MQYQVLNGTHMILIQAEDEFSTSGSCSGQLPIYHKFFNGELFPSLRIPFKLGLASSEGQSTARPDPVIPQATDTDLKGRIGPFQVSLEDQSKAFIPLTPSTQAEQVLLQKTLINGHCFAILTGLLIGICE
jgi:hypothetical protein